MYVWHSYQNIYMVLHSGLHYKTRLIFIPSEVETGLYHGEHSWHAIAGNYRPATETPFIVSVAGR